MTDTQTDSLYLRWKRGDMEWYINQGAIKPTIVTYCNIYDCYKPKREAGMSYMQAVESTAEEMNTSPDTVKRAIAAVM